jgi:hypothetical protein
MAKINAKPAAVLLTALAVGGCLDFRGVGPENPEPGSPPRVVDVTIEYRQPNGCLNAPERCDDPVVFFGTWMRPGAEFPLTRDPQTFIYRGTAVGVPVNYPSVDEPYVVRIFDPHLVNTETLGITALRLKVGRESLNSFGDLGTPLEHGKVYIDGSGFGHNPT